MSHAATHRNQMSHAGMHRNQMSHAGMHRNQMSHPATHRNQMSHAGIQRNDILQKLDDNYANSKTSIQVEHIQFHFQPATYLAIQHPVPTSDPAKKSSTIRYLNLIFYLLILRAQDTILATLQTINQKRNVRMTNNKNWAFHGRIFL